MPSRACPAVDYIHVPIIPTLRDALSPNTMALKGSSRQAVATQTGVSGLGQEGLMMAGCHTCVQAPECARFQDSQHVEKTMACTRTCRGHVYFPDIEFTALGSGLLNKGS